MEYIDKVVEREILKVVPNAEITDDTDLTTATDFKVTGRSSKSLPLRFAIAIDNPDINAKNPKIIGELSDTIYLRYGRSGGNDNFFKYFWNEIDIKMFGTNRW